MRALITGAAGFIGSHLIDCLADAHPGDEIVAVQRTLASISAHPSVRVEACDILAEQGQVIGAVIRRSEPEVVYHLAGRSSGADADRDALVHANVDGTRYVLDACRALRNPPRVVFASTGYVYLRSSEDAPAREGDLASVYPGMSAYAESKVLAEAEVRKHGAFCVTARIFNCTGPGQSPTFAVPAFARQVALIEAGRQAPEILVGNLAMCRDLLDVRDAVRALVLLAELGRPGEAYNVCTGRATSMRRVLSHLLAIAGVRAEAVPDPRRERTRDAAVVVGDPEKLHSATGWSPTYDLDTTLRDTLDYWRDRAATG